MIALLQRVARASVSVDGTAIARIGPGLLVLVGVERDDGPAQARRLAERLLAFRAFEDPAGRMNVNVVDKGGSVLLVPQFTLAADTSRGNRPGFSGAAQPAAAEALFGALAEHVAAQGLVPARGRFGAHMQVSLVNDGPVTFWVRVPPPGASAIT
jgi:D-tyrosyl-tRNA(Tyr) deacylase